MLLYREIKVSSSLNMFLKLWFRELYSVYNEYKEDWNSESHLYLDFSDDHRKYWIWITNKRKISKALLSYDKRKTEWRSWSSYFKYKIGDSFLFIIQIIELIKS